MKPLATTIATSLLLAACSGFPPPASAIGRMADISVYDRTEQRTLPVHWHKGQAWIAGSPGNEYQVSVRNSTGGDVLAVVSVDGVNVITGETASPSQTGYIVDGWRNLSVKGWRKDLNRTAAFHFTSLANSYAAKTGRPDNVGVIGVALFNRKMEQQAAMDSYFRAPPASEAPARSSAPAMPSAPAPAQSVPMERSAPLANLDFSKREPRNDTARLGTGHGRSEYSQIRMVDFERATPHPEETLTIRYDSHSNLVARGIIVARAPDRVPNPFPNSPQGFVPDPPRW